MRKIAPYAEPCSQTRCRNRRADPGGKGKLIMVQPEWPAEVTARDGIAHLQQSIHGLMDGDRVLPADGSSLLEPLELALEGLTSENPSSARAGIVAFIRRVEALIAAGAIETVDGRRPLETADALLAVLGALLAVLGE
jgi:hypothetical protein